MPLLVCVHTLVYTEKTFGKKLRSEETWKEERFFSVYCVFLQVQREEGGKGIRNIIDIKFQERRHRIKRILKNG